MLQKISSSVIFIFLWFFLAPCASALTSGTPHAVRALFFLPIYQIFSAYGFLKLIYYLRKNFSVLVYRIISNFIFLFFILNFFYYLHMYWIHTPIEYSQWWQYGYKEVVEEVKKIERKYSRIVITYKYDQPYIYFLFYFPIDPFWYQKNWGEGEIKRSERKFGKYEFRRIVWNEDSNLPNTLLIGSPDEIPENPKGLIKEIKFLDGSVAFRIVEN